MRARPIIGCDPEQVDKAQALYISGLEEATFDAYVDRGVIHMPAPSGRKTYWHTATLRAEIARLHGIVRSSGHERPTNQPNEIRQARRKAQKADRLGAA